MPAIKHLLIPLLTFAAGMYVGTLTVTEHTFTATGGKPFAEWPICLHGGKEWPAFATGAGTYVCRLP